MYSDTSKKIRWRVLVFPAGNENAIEIWRALSLCKEVGLYAASSPIPTHANFIYKHVSAIPSVQDNDDWVAAINSIVKNQHIDFIYPANDTVIKELNFHRQKINCPLLLPCSQAVTTCLSKTKTKKVLSPFLPVVRSPGESGAPSLPIVIKPDSSYGGQGVQILYEKPPSLSATDSDVIVEEYLPGKEYSVDCFTNRQGKLLFCSGRERVRIRMGTSMRGRLADKETQCIFKQWAEIISQQIGMRGGWFFQAKKDHTDQLRLTEVDVRIAGTMVLNRVRGVNFPLLTLYDAAGMDVQINCLEDASIEIDRALCNRYSHQIKYKTVYIDWDDTIILNKKINLLIVRFLFQCINQGVRIVLLTHSQAKNLSEEITSYRLAGLFDKIIHIPETVDKASQIDPQDAIFIDDSFSHRQKVFATHHIPCFSPDMVELLLCDRIE